MTGIMMIDDVTSRRRQVMKIMSQLKKSGQRINRYIIKDQLDKLGFEVSVATVYRDMTAVNRENTWVRDLAESNYSAYQEDISNNLEWIESQASQQFESTNNHVWLNIILKVQDSRIKHTNGENINISVALLGKKFKELTDDKQPVTPLQEETPDNMLSHPMVDVIKLCKQQNNDDDT